MRNGSISQIYTVAEYVQNIFKHFLVNREKYLKNIKMVAVFLCCYIKISSILSKPEILCIFATRKI